MKRIAQTIRCDGYFGHFYVVGDRLLVATATELICFGEDADLIWKRSNLAIDGVIVDGIGDGVIEGQGEWDPPGGWRTFRLLLSTGEPT